MARMRPAKERPVEQPAVRTTIVGGRPPGAGKGVGEIPRGIEVLVKKASVDAGFRKVLLEKRAEAAREIALELDPAEVMMLNAVPAAQLEGIIARTTVSPGKKLAFLGRAAAVMLAALGTGIGCDQGIKVTGSRPNPPKAEKSVGSKSASGKASTQTPATPKASTQTTVAPLPAVIAGIVPTPPKATTQTPTSLKPSTQAPAQKSPIPMPVAGAVRQGIDYPSQPGPMRMAGVRSDRPDDGATPKGDVKPTTNAPAANDAPPPELQRAIRGLRPMREEKAGN